MKVKLFMTFAVIFWWSVLSVFDTMHGRWLAEQIRSSSWPTTPGVIESSATTQRGSGKGGATQGVNLQYRYAVQGTEHVGTRYRADDMSTNGSWASSVVKSLPAGTVVQVHYDPNDPSRSLLLAGVTGFNLFLTLFLLPFNMLGLWLAWMTCGLWREGWQSEDRPAFAVREAPGRWSICLQQSHPLATSLVLASFGSLPIVLLCGFVSTNMDLPVWAGVAAIAMILSGWAAAFFVLMLRRRSGKLDLVCDEVAGTLELPAMFGRTARNELVVEDIECITTGTFVPGGLRGDNAVWRVSARTRRSEVEIVLAETWNDTGAERTARWLRKRLGKAAAAEGQREERLSP